MTQVHTNDMGINKQSRYIKWSRYIQRKQNTEKRYKECKSNDELGLFSSILLAKLSPGRSPSMVSKSQNVYKTHIQDTVPSGSA